MYYNPDNFFKQQTLTYLFVTIIRSIDHIEPKINVLIIRGKHFSGVDWNMRITWWKINFYLNQISYRSFVFYFQSFCSWVLSSYLPLLCCASLAHVTGQNSGFLDAEQSASLHALGSEHFSGQISFASSFVQSIFSSLHMLEASMNYADNMWIFKMIYSNYLMC